MYLKFIRKIPSFYSRLFALVKTLCASPPSWGGCIVNSLFDANKYFNDQEPWNKKEDRKRLNTIIYVSLELIRKISIMLYPIIPSSTIKSLSIFNIKEKDILFESIANHKYLKSNNKIFKVDILFKKIIK